MVLDEGGLRDDDGEVVCRDDSIESYVRIEKTPFDVAVRKAFAEEKDGPGVTGF